MIESKDLKSYKAAVRKEMDKKFQRAVLDKFAVDYRAARRNAFLEQDEVQLIREAAQVKQYAVDHMDELYAAFKEKAEAAGVHVHLANTADEANSIINAIARENDCTRVAKAKSMTSEEIFLTSFLEAEGLEVTETDLGEWIVQQRHEHPSHMVLPAIHLSRRDVAELFTRLTGKQQEPDIATLVRVARRELRHRFVQADLGITGANFALADTGSIGLVTNEGNARLVTTLPRVHVALVGLEKLFPSFKEALKVLDVLPRNATGQAITSYITWITGAVPCGATTDGRKVMHVVFLDNGRRKIAADPVFSQVLRCVRCGACANVCPCYRMIGGHKYGHVYIGAVGLVLTYFFHGADKGRALVHNCLNCEACRAVCAAEIDLPVLIKEVQNRIQSQDGFPLFSRMIGTVLRNRKLFHGFLRTASVMQKPMVSQGTIRHLPFVLQEHQFKKLPGVAEKPFRDRWPAMQRKRTGAPKHRVALFGGCVQDFVYPEQLEAAVRTMERKGTVVEFPMGQTCCGLPARMMGETAAAREVALHNLMAIDPEEYDSIVSLCASCTDFLQHGYPLLLRGEAKDSRLERRVRRFVDKVVDYSSFLWDVLQLRRRDFQKPGQSVTYHYPCHQCRGMSVLDQPKEIIRAAGFEFREAEEEDVCCGLGGTYSVKFPEISKEILAKKLDNLEATGADMVLTECPGCVLQIRGGMLARKGRMQVLHLAEALDQVLLPE